MFSQTAGLLDKFMPADCNEQWKLSWNQYKLYRLLAYNDDGHATVANGTQQNELYPVGIQQRRTQPQGTFSNFKS